MLRFCFVLVTTVFFASVPSVQSLALSLPEIDAKAQAYIDALKTKYGAKRGAAAPLLQRAVTASKDKNWSEAVRLLEEGAGRSLGGEPVTGKTSADLLHMLAEAWAGHQKASEEGLWAAYIAQKMPPRDRGAGNLASLAVLGQILVEQISALHANFDYRGFTLRLISDRLTELEYGPARIAAEDAQGQLPATVRELVDLKAREERERIILIERVTASMGFASQLYQEIARNPAHAELGSELEKAAKKKLFYVRRVYLDARRDSAAICLEFNLPLRPDAGEYRDMVKVIALGPRGNVTGDVTIADRTVKDQAVCLHGLRHGTRYHVVARKGFPSRSGATLVEDFDTRLAREEASRDPADPATRPPVPRRPPGSDPTGAPRSRCGRIRRGGLRGSRTAAARAAR